MSDKTLIKLIKRARRADVPLDDPVLEKLIDDVEAETEAQEAEEKQSVWNQAKEFARDNAKKFFAWLSGVIALVVGGLVAYFLDILNM